VKESLVVNAERLTHRHIPALDGLRGLAIIVVIVCHANWALGGPLIPGRVNGPLGMVFGWGWVGVDLPVLRHLRIAPASV
jgi:peptidoglycan/LPS O-acetylase OafA/YrhL